MPAALQHYEVPDMAGIRRRRATLLARGRIERLAQ